MIMSSRYRVLTLYDGLAILNIYYKYCMTSYCLFVVKGIDSDSPFVCDDTVNK